MDTHDAIRTRRTIHKYLPEPVPEDVLQRALEAAHMAPCHRMTWPWRFYRVGPETRRRIVDVAIEVKSAKKPNLSEAEKNAIRAKISNPAELLVVTQVVCDDPMQFEEDYAAVACALQNLMLSVAADGYGTKWGSGGVTKAPGSYAAAGIDADVERIVGFLYVGVPAVVPKIQRPEVAAVVRQLS
jgi:nitroreductase